MAAFGLYSHIQSNKRRSIALLISLFLLVYVLVYAAALLAESMSYDASLDWLLRRAWRDTLQAAPWATLGTVIWIVIAYYFHQSMIDAVTGGQEISRTEMPRLYNLVENLCIARGLPVPKLKVMESDSIPSRSPRPCSIGSTTASWSPSSATSSPTSATATCACWSSR